ncbi:MAG: hypothetical protein IPJ82_09705 [Lewinellaceae bacterium]|nr:hypothetical protein [Lewinellaceae bacterium]
MLRSASLSRRFANAPPVVFVVVAGCLAFLVYCSVYAFRKPFTAATYEGLAVGGIHFKIILVTLQVAGYALSKFIGIRVIAGMPASGRFGLLAGMMGIAGTALLGFALTPYPWNCGWMFANGLSLGMAWGVIFSYLEGRRVTEMLAAFLCANFIFSSGFVKTAGQWLLTRQGISEQWMPFVAAMLFFPLLLLGLWMLEHLPPPSQADVAQRSARVRMLPEERKTLFFKFAPGLVTLVGIYLVLTIIRDVRDNFAVEIWNELGFGGRASILTAAEAPVAVFSLLVVGGMIFVKNNLYAVWLSHAMILLGGVVLFGSTLLFQCGIISPVFWMVLSGTGLFLPYVLFNGKLFDRLLAGFRESGNVGFLIYIADSFGYLGSVAVLLWRNFGAPGISWLSFFSWLCYIGAVLIFFLAFVSYGYFLKKSRNDDPVKSHTNAPEQLYPSK